ncbi:MAG: SNF2 helicase associated domain-containing protein, partial [Candidatus Margulisbacteria bacterium]|nr:SNF2 helicase associated domain-containing protein [Candidatus Margulisiibacteriota bacterium]
MIDFFLALAQAPPNVVFHYDVILEPLSIALEYDRAEINNLKDLPRERVSVPEQALINILVQQPAKNGRYNIAREYRERALYLLQDILPGRVVLPPEKPEINLRYILEPTRQNCKIWVDFAGTPYAALREVPRDKLSRAERVFINFLAGVPVNGGCFFVGQHQLARMYYFLARTPNVLLKSGRQLLIHNTPPNYQGIFRGERGRYEFALTLAGDVLSRRNCQLIGEKNFVLFHQGVVYALDNISALLFERYLPAPVYLMREEIPKFAADCLLPLAARGLNFNFPAEFTALNASVVGAPPAPVLAVLGESAGRLKIKIKYDYGLKILPEYARVDNAEFYRVEQDGREYFLKRDKKSEDWLHTYLSERRFLAENDGYTVEHDDFVDFMTYEFPGLKQNIGLKILGERLEQYVYADQEFDIDLDFRQSSGIDWFEFAPVYKVKDAVFTHAQIQDLLAAEKEYVRLPDGSLVKIPRREFDYLQSYLAGRSQKTANGKYQVRKYDLYYLYSGVRDQMKARMDESLQTLLNSLENFSGIPPRALPQGLKGAPRSYQLLGYYWLQFLHDHNFHGILADDMG